jgi:hypothetical protein
MTTIPSGAVKFSDLQSVLGGTNPIKFSEYYANATEGYATGVSGIPNKNALIRMSVFRGKSKPASGNGLYAFSSHTFTNASVTGRFGPTLSQCRTAYSSASWAQDTTNNYLNMTSQGIQLWKVPATGSYTIQAAGARGGAGTATERSGGHGAACTGTFNLTQGHVVQILVGQSGLNRSGNASNTSEGSGGGGTFVALSDNTPLIVAGGGGGAGYLGNGLNASTSTSGSSGASAGSGAGGINGGGGGGARSGTAGDGYTAGGDGVSCSYGAGGGGFYSKGGENCSGGEPLLAGASFLGGGTGGQADSARSGVQGGFGGGSGVGHRSPGGGGYSGGGGDGGDNGGGGGGSYNSGTNQTNVSAGNYGNGYVSITANFTITASSSTSSSLYTFTSHTFTNATATGRTGPTLSLCRTAYSSATWAQKQ